MLHAFMILFSRLSKKKKGETQMWKSVSRYDVSKDTHWLFFSFVSI